MRPSAIGTGTPNQRATRRRLGLASSTWPDSCRSSATSSCPSKLASSRSPFSVSLVGQRACVGFSAGGVSAPSKASRCPRKVKLPLAAIWPLRRPGQLSLDVAERLRRPVRGGHVQRALAHRQGVEAHGEQLLHQQRRERAGKRGLEVAVEVRGAGAQARRVEVEHRRIEDEAGDGRAGRRVAVGIEGAAAERQIGSVAQPDRRRDHVHVARRGHHGVARERLVGGAGAEQHRRKDGEQQTGKRRENERGEAGNDVLASHAVDFSLALSGRAGVASHVGYDQLPAAVRACVPICFYKPVPSSASCSAQHNAFFLSTRLGRRPLAH